MSLRTWILYVAAFFLASAALIAQPKSNWHAATPTQLEAFLPARAPVEKERIETEMRTATGIVNEHGKMVAAVVLITAGYAANGKYSHYLLTQNALKIGDVKLGPGAYVLGWTRTDDGLLVKLYEASSGIERGSVVARIPKPPIKVEPFRIWPPADRSVIQIGRFLVPYSLE